MVLTLVTQNGQFLSDHEFLVIWIIEHLGTDIACLKTTYCKFRAP